MNLTVLLDATALAAWARADPPTAALAAGELLREVTTGNDLVGASVLAVDAAFRDIGISSAAGDLLRELITDPRGVTVLPFTGDFLPEASRQDFAVLGLWHTAGLAVETGIAVATTTPADYADVADVDTLNISETF